jgi:hypothetical protein
MIYTKALSKFFLNTLLLKFWFRPSETKLPCQKTSMPTGESRRLDRYKKTCETDWKSGSRILKVIESGYRHTSDLDPWLRK